jgi:hypothetical protein
MNALKKWSKRTVWLALAAVLTIGCSPIQTLGFLLHKDDKLPAKYPLRPKEGPKKDKDEEIKLLILCDRGPNVPQEFAMIQNDLASALAKQISEVAKDNKEKFTVVSAAEVMKYKQGNPNWKSQHPSEIGKKFNADYVIDITLSNIGVYQAGSGREIYEGRAEVYVDVFETALGKAEPKDKYVHPYTYPKTGMIAASNLPLSQFKQMYVNQLALEILEKHLEHRPSEGLAAER